MTVIAASASPSVVRPLSESSYLSRAAPSAIGRANRTFGIIESNTLAGRWEDDDGTTRSGWTAVHSSRWGPAALVAEAGGWDRRGAGRDSPVHHRGLESL